MSRQRAHTKGGVRGVRVTLVAARRPAPAARAAPSGDPLRCLIGARASMEQPPQNHK